ncbi:hypothetical protein [Streptomyces virginiae]|uniref:hypothetical protein n=1 Tax=Streptomyces virginiae TaxID=1961 RepID=UPI00342A9CE5
MLPAQHLIRDSPVRRALGVALQYALKEIPLTVAGLDDIDLKPEEIAHVLRGTIGAGTFRTEAAK